MGLSDCRVESAVAVSDLDRARRFYEEGLGLAPGEQEEGVSVRYPCGDDLGETMDELGSRGVGFEQYDQPGLKTDDQGVFEGPGFRAAWVKDPDGNTLAITEEQG